MLIKEKLPENKLINEITTEQMLIKEILSEKNNPTNANNTGISKIYKQINRIKNKEN